MDDGEGEGDSGSSGDGEDVCWCFWEGGGEDVSAVGSVQDYGRCDATALAGLYFCCGEASEAACFAGAGADNVAVVLCPAIRGKGSRCHGVGLPYREFGEGKEEVLAIFPCAMGKFEVEDEDGSFGVGM